MNKVSWLYEVTAQIFVPLIAYFASDFVRKILPLRTRTIQANWITSRTRSVHRCTHQQLLTVGLSYAVKCRIVHSGCDVQENLSNLLTQEISVERSLVWQHVRLRLGKQIYCEHVKRAWNIFLSYWRIHTRLQGLQRSAVISNAYAPITKRIFPKNEKKITRERSYRRHPLQNRLVWGVPIKPQVTTFQSWMGVQTKKQRWLYLHKESKFSGRRNKHKEMKLPSGNLKTSMGWELTCALW